MNACFRTLTANDLPRTLGYVESWIGAGFPKDSSEKKAAMRKWDAEASAWGKQTCYKFITRNPTTIECQVYQDGRRDSLVPCANACLAAAGAASMQTMMQHVLVSEPRSGCTYDCEIYRRDSGVVEVHASVLFSIGTSPIICDYDRSIIGIDNYSVFLDGSKIEASEACKVPSDRAALIKNDKNVEFYNHHGLHGSAPLTGIITLCRILALGVLSPDLLVDTIEGVYLKRMITTEVPGMRHIRLPVRKIQVGDVDGIE